MSLRRKKNELESELAELRRRPMGGEVADAVQGQSDAIDVDAVVAAGEASAAGPLSVARMRPSEDLLVPAVRFDHARLQTPDKPMWPVDKVTLAAAGPFAPGMKAYLNDQEPLVGLLAEELGSSSDAIQQAREVIVAIGYLHITHFVTLVILSGHRSQFADLSANEQIRNAWLDRYPNDLARSVGWSPWANYVEEYQKLDGYKMLVQFSALWGPVTDRYPDVPVEKLRRSAMYKLVTEVSLLVGLTDHQGLNLMGMQNYLPIRNWHEFLRQTQGLVPDPFFIQFNTILDGLKAACSPGYEIGQLDALKSFAWAFGPPYLLSDMETWRGVAAVTYEPLSRHEDLAKMVASLSSNPFGVAHGTELPDSRVFEELAETIFWVDQRVDGDWNSPAQAIEYHKHLRSLQVLTISRHHYPGRRLAASVQALWQAFAETERALLERALGQQEAISSGVTIQVPGQAAMGGIQGSLWNRRVRASMAGMSCLRVVER